MTRVRSVLVGAIAFVAVACGSPDEPTTPALTTPQPPPADLSAAEAVAGIPPEPDPANWQAYVAALDAIDPGIVDGDEERAVDHGRDQCSSIAQWPGDQAKLIDLTQRRFTSSEHPDGFGPDASAQILVAVREYICPGR